jgi:arginine utilization protein RocB
MNEKIKKLEELLELKYEEWTPETLLRVIKEENLLVLFSTDVAAHLAETKKNPLIESIMQPVKYGHYLKEVKNQIESYLKDLKEEKSSPEEFKTRILSMKNNGGPLQRSGAYLTILSTIESYEFTDDDKLDVSKSLKELIDIINSLDFDNGFQIIIGLIDLIFPIRELYFSRYQKDPLENMEELNAILKKLDEITKEFFDSEEEHEHSHEDGDHEEK